jgi:hypothetical protein
VVVEGASAAGFGLGSHIRAVIEGKLQKNLRRSRNGGGVVTNSKMIRIKRGYVFKVDGANIINCPIHIRGCVAL